MTDTTKSLANVLASIGFENVDQIGKLAKAATSDSAEQRVLQMLWMAVGQVEEDLRREAFQLDQLATGVARESTNLESGMRTITDWIMQGAVKVSEIDAAIKANITRVQELTMIYRLF